MTDHEEFMDTERILRGVNDKDSSVWNVLFAYYYPQLCSYASRLLRNEEEAEDCIQNVLLYVWNCDRKFPHIEDLTYFLYRVSHNQAMMKLRHEKCKKHHHSKILKDGDDVSDDMFAEIVRGELIRQLYDRIEELPEEQQKVIRLCISGLSNQEIADQLGVSINTVKTHKSRSFKFLRGRMEEWGQLLWVYVFGRRYH